MDPIAFAVSSTVAVALAAVALGVGVMKAIEVLAEADEMLAGYADEVDSD